MTVMTWTHRHVTMIRIHDGYIVFDKSATKDIVVIHCHCPISIRLSGFYCVVKKSATNIKWINKEGSIPFLKPDFSKLYETKIQGIKF